MIPAILYFIGGVLVVVLGAIVFAWLDGREADNDRRLKLAKAQRDYGASA